MEKPTILYGLRPMTTRGRKMTYKLEPSLARISSPVILILPGGEKKEYENGTEVCRAVFKHRYRVVEVRAIENKIKISLEESDEPNQSFF